MKNFLNIYGRVQLISLALIIAFFFIGAINGFALESGSWFINAMKITATVWLISGAIYVSFLIWELLKD